MFAYPTEAYTSGGCESDREFRALECDGTLQAAIESYGIGMRSTSILMTLAYARVWGNNIGVSVWPPGNVATQTEWDRILDGLVERLLGRYRCLDCGNFHSVLSPIFGGSCPQCGGVSEEVV